MLPDQRQGIRCHETDAIFLVGHPEKRPQEGAFVFPTLVPGGDEFVNLIFCDLALLVERQKCGARIQNVRHEFVSLVGRLISTPVAACENAAVVACAEKTYDFPMTCVPGEDQATPTTPAPFAIDLPEVFARVEETWFRNRLSAQTGCSVCGATKTDRRG